LVFMAVVSALDRLVSVGLADARSWQKALFGAAPPVVATVVEVVEPDDAWVVVVVEDELVDELQAASPRLDASTAIPIQVRRPLI
jgi:hypothetical protein